VRTNSGELRRILTEGARSSLDAITGIEMSELLEELPLSAPVMQA